MSDDPRCCGTGTCIINAEGLCWCGQRWDGEKMCFMPEPQGLSKPGQATAERRSDGEPDAQARG
ncbi:hypothetical protein ACHEXK_10675 [Limnohabitans sp. DCL3]|uniref:hypothetical protein n=1 Tax=Limnohabitans sp. DCL3 TaxID=3374103 RepID=UPI003A84D416